MKEDIYSIIKARISAIPLNKVKEDLAKDFYNIEDIIEFLYYAMLSEGNCILYGPGGFGKSQVTKAFFEYFKINTIVQIGHSGTDVEALLGIPNMKKLLDESKYEVAFENSIFKNSGVLILEEFLDVKPSVASALKDIITEGGYRYGDKFIKSNIGPIIICSNKSPEEVSTDLSTTAFYKERFPYSKFVIWNTYKASDYFNLFKVKYDVRKDEDMFKFIAEICTVSCIDGEVISPRIAFKAVDIFNTTKNIESLKMISSLNLDKIEEIKYKLRIEKQHLMLYDKFKYLKSTIIALELESFSEALAFINFSKGFRKLIDRFNIQNESVLIVISELLNIISIKESEVYLLLENMQWKSEDKLDDLKLVYEEIQEYAI